MPAAVVNSHCLLLLANRAHPHMARFRGVWHLLWALVKAHCLQMRCLLDRLALLWYLSLFLFLQDLLHLGCYRWVQHLLWLQDRVHCVQMRCLLDRMALH